MRTRSLRTRSLRTRSLRTRSLRTLALAMLLLLSLLAPVGMAPAAASAQEPTAAGPAPDSVPKYVPLMGIAAIATSFNHTCALSTAGGVKCWGRDDFGQLGDGTVASPVAVATPQNVVGLTSGVKAIAAGYEHTCALTTAGGVKCWGYDGFGQLGDGTVASPAAVATPQDAVGLSSGVASIAAGLYYTCALTAAGGLKCWGEDAYGQLGDGTVATPASVATPQDVSGLALGVTAVAAGNRVTCALTTPGGLKCWGNDGSGELGDGAVGNPPAVATPQNVFGLASGVTAIAIGLEHTCALTTAGGVKCWGDDGAGQLGDGAASNPGSQPVPQDVVVGATCFKLTLAGAGGPAPVPAFDRTLGCPPSHYLAGSGLPLTAFPGVNQRVQAWSAPVNALPGAASVTLSMPAADSTVTVAYGACHLLTLTAAGPGQTPKATPDRSDGCAAGRFGAGQGIVLVGLPNANHRVQAWSGTTATPGAGLEVNTITMPAANAAASVTYQPCLALVATKQGEGSLPAPLASNSLGCLEGLFVTGEQVPVSASPAAGWRVAGWSGTTNNAAQATTNTVLMGAGAAHVEVIYEPDAALTMRVLLPIAKR